MKSRVKYGPKWRLKKPAREEVEKVGACDDDDDDVSVAAARSHDHVLVLLVEHRLGVVEVDDRDWVEHFGRTARVGEVEVASAVAQRLDVRLHDGVVRGVHSAVEREAAEALTPVRNVVARGDDPVLLGE